MRFLILVLLLAGFAQAEETLVRYREASKVSLNEADYVNTFIPTYEYDGPDAEEDLQCPIPKEDRVRNHTGIQCVYSSIEALGRWAEEPKLVDPPLTSRPECKSYSSPNQAAKVLNRLNVRFAQTYGNKERGRELIRHAMRTGRGCLWDVPGHAMILVHYDEEGDRVCWVDNSDRSLKVQQTTIDKFDRRWGSWILVVYADKDVVPEKTRHYNFPFLDHSCRETPERGFVPFPEAFAP